MKKLRKYLPIIKIALTAVLLILALFLPISQNAKLGLYIAALVVIGIEPFIESLKIFKSFSLDENLLMVIASVGAFVLGEYAEGILVLLLYAIGSYFEHHAVNKSRTYISQIVEMRIPYANVYRNGEYVEVDPEEVKKGELILIKVGERVPLDGVLTEGSTTLDTSALTGESVPRSAKVGDSLVSGCINLTNAVVMKVEREYEDSTVAKILDMVENSALNKAKAENFIAKFARFYTPIVVGLAVLIAVIPPLIDNMQWEKWIYRALSFLVISCPCALVISVPLSFFRGIGLSSKRGILIKGSNYMEKLARLKAVACDKTGTLTKGQFAIAEVTPVEGNEDFLSLAKAIESRSNHPIAKSIVGDNHFKVDFEDYEEISGRGVRAKIGGKTYYAGNAALMQDIGAETDVYVGSGSVVYFAEENKYLGRIVVKDEIKEEAYSLKEKLSKQGVEKISLLSGDSPSVCEEVAKNLGIADCKGGLLPQDKVVELNRIKEEI